MATVYLARDLKHDRLVAIKVLHPHLTASLGPERFLREISLTARLDHPHILPVFDSGEAGGLLWYSMPYVEGESLRNRLRREGQLPLGDAVRVAREAADALECAHRHGIVHRDIKPENILLSNSHARIADFGVARALEAAAASQLTATGLTVGTPAYMSPEQASGGQVDARSDVYALACVLFEMLAGEPPYTGPTAQAVIAKRFTGPIPHLGTVRTVPQAVDAVVTRALARVAADRFGSAAEFASALEFATAPTSTEARPTHRRPRITSWLTLAAAGTVLVVVAMYLAGRRTAAPPVAHTKAAAAPAASAAASVAVLPFTNLSPDRDNEYFSDGMTEELIAALGKVPGMRVAARSSSFAFKGKNADIHEVAEKLNVATVLEGSVRKAGMRLRVSAQLVKAADGYQLWSDTYDRELEDVFAVQDEIARAITGALQVRLADAQNTPVVGRPTQSIEAYNLYLQGRSFWNQRTANSLLTAARYLERATAIDSNYAEAHAALAEAYVLFAPYGVSTPKEAYSKAKTAAMRALALDSTLAPAWAALAHIRWRYEHDFVGAGPAFRRVIQLDPRYPTGHQWYSEYLSLLGRHDEALAESDRGTSLDPLSRTIAGSKCNLLFRARRYEEAVFQCRKALELDPDFPTSHVYLGRVYLKKGMTREGVAEVEKSVRLGGPTVGFGGLGLLAYGYSVSGNRKRGLELLQQLRDRARHQYIGPSQFAWAYAGLGDKDRALAWLARAAEERDASLPNILSPDPLWDGLSSDPRFAALRKQVGLD